MSGRRGNAEDEGERRERDVKEKGLDGGDVAL